MEDTKIYAQDEFTNDIIIQGLKEVYEILEEKGYSPVNQIVGYLMSDDLGYITSYKNARSIISKFERSEILEVLIRKIL